MKGIINFETQPLVSSDFKGWGLPGARLCQCRQCRQRRLCRDISQLTM